MNLRSFAPSLLVLAALLAACGGGRKAHRYQNELMDFGAVEAVAVLPFHNLTRDQAASDRVRDVFANMLLASGAVYVVPHGEVLRALGRAGVSVPTQPAIEDVVKLGKQLQVQAVITGVVREAGEVRTGLSTANVVSMAVQMIETETGKVVWSASSSRGGVTLTMRLVGTGGPPLNAVTEQAVRDLLDQLLE